MEDVRVFGRGRPPIEEVGPSRLMAPEVERPILVQRERIEDSRSDLLERAAFRRFEETRNDIAGGQGEAVRSPRRERSVVRDRDRVHGGDGYSVKGARRDAPHRRVLAEGDEGAVGADQDRIISA